RTGTAPPEALVDRLARGPVERTGWVADGDGPQSARLAWATPIEAKAVVLYAPWSERKAGTDARIDACTLIFTLHGREVGRASTRGAGPEGPRVAPPPVGPDALEVRPTAHGKVDGRPACALAEIETIARLPE